MRHYYSLEHCAMRAGIPLHTNIETLSGELGVHDVVFPYHGYTVAAWHPSKSEKCSSAVYAFDGSDHSNHGSISLVYLMEEEFSDMGEAVKYALTRAELIQADKLMQKEV